MLHKLHGIARKRGAAARLTLLALLGSVVAAVVTAALVGGGVTPSAASTASLACQSISGELLVAISGQTTSSDPLVVSTDGAGNSSSSTYAFSGSGSGVSTSACEGGGIQPATTVAPTDGTIVLSQPATASDDTDTLTIGANTIKGATTEDGLEEVTAPGGFPNVTVGMSVSDADHNIPSGTTVAAIPSDSLPLSAAATGTLVPSATTFAANPATVSINSTAVTATIPGSVVSGMTVSDSQGCILPGTTVSSVDAGNTGIVLSAEAKQSPTGACSTSSTTDQLTFSDDVTFTSSIANATVTAGTGAASPASIISLTGAANLVPGMEVWDAAGCVNGVATGVTYGTTTVVSVEPEACSTPTVNDTVFFSTQLDDVSTADGSQDVTASSGAGGFPDVVPNMSVTGPDIPDTAAAGFGVPGTTTVSSSPNTLTLSATPTATSASCSLTFGTDATGVHLSNNSTTVTLNTGVFTNVVPGMSVTQVTGGSSKIPSSTLVDWVSGNTVNLTNAATGNVTSAELQFSTSSIAVETNTSSGEVAAIQSAATGGILPSPDSLVGGFPGVATGMTVESASSGCGINTSPSGPTVSAVGAADVETLSLPATANNTANLTFTTSVGSVSTTTGSPTITTTGASAIGFPGVVAGMSVLGTNIPADTTVSAVDGTSLTLSANASNSGTGQTVTFSTSVSSAEIIDSSSSVSDATGFPDVQIGMGVSGDAFLVSVDPTVIITGPASTSQYVEIDNSKGYLASSASSGAAAGCIPQFQLQLPTTATGSTLAVLNNSSNPSTGDDSVAVTSAVSGQGTSENVTLSEGACTSPDLIVPAGYAVPTLDLQGASSESGNVLDLSQNSATSMGVDALGEGATAIAVPNVTVTASSTTVTVPSSSFPAGITSGMGVSDTAACIPAGDTFVSSATNAGTVTITLSSATTAASPSGTCVPSTADELTFGVGTVTGMPGSVPIEFSQEQTVKGAAASTDFVPSTLASIAFDGGSGVTNTLDLAPDSGITSPTVVMNGDTSSSIGQYSFNAGPTVDNFYNVGAVKGSTSVATSFQPGSATGVTFTGGSGLANMVDLSGETTTNFSALTVEMNGTGSCSSESEILGSGTSSLTDCFSNAETLNGQTAVPTTFQPGTGSVSGVTFEANGHGILDLSGENGSAATLAVSLNGNNSSSPGDLTGTGSGGSTLADSFYGVSSVLGSPNGTTFQPGSASGVTMSGSSSAPNTLLLGNESQANGSDVSSFTVAMTSTSCGGNGQLTGTIVHSTISDCFSNVGSVQGGSGNAVTDTLQLTSGSNMLSSTTGFVGIVPGMVVSDSTTPANIPTGTYVMSVSGKTLTLSANAGGGTSDSLSFAAAASDVPTIFQPGTVNNVTFTGGPNAGGANAAQNTVDLTSESAGNFSSLKVTMSNTVTCSGTGEGQVQGSSGTNVVVTDCFTSVKTVNGATAVPTTFQPGTGSVSGVAFDATGNGILDLSGENSSATNLAVSLNGNNSSSPGELTGIGSGDSSLADSFYGLASVLGSPNGTTFQPGSATGVTLSGSSGASNALLLGNESQPHANNGSGATAFTVAMTSASCAGSGQLTGTTTTGSISDCFSSVSSVYGGSSITDILSVATGSNTITSTTGFPGVVAGMSVSDTANDLTGLSVLSVSGNTLTLSGPATGTSASDSVTFGSITDSLGLTGGSNTITSTTGFAGVVAGMSVTDKTTPANIPSNTTVSKVSGQTITLSNNAGSTATADSLVFAPATSDVPTTFQPSTVTGVTFTGGADIATTSTAQNTLDLTSESASSFDGLKVTMAGTAPCIGEGEVVSASGSAVALTDCFTSVKTVNGATAVATTFQPGTGSVSGISFGAVAGDGILDLSGENGSAASLAVALNGNSAASPGDLTGTGSAGGNGSSLADSFYGVDSVVGSPNGTTFRPGSATGVDMIGSSGAVNILRLGNESQTTGSDVSGFTVAMTSAACGSNGQLTGTSASGSISDCFSNVSSVSGVSLTTTVNNVTFSSGSATLTSATGFPGVIAGMSVSDTTTPANLNSGDYVEAVSGETLTLGNSSLPTTPGSSAVSGDSLSFAAATTDVPTTFEPGTVTGVNFAGGPNISATSSAQNTLDLTSESASSFKALTVAMSSTGPCAATGPGELSSASGSSVALTDCFSSVKVVNGATSVPTTFQPGTVDDVSFTGGTGSGVVNTIDLSGETTLSPLTVAMTATCPTGLTGSGEITGGPTATPTLVDCFSNATVVNGSSTIGTAFEPGSVNGVTFNGGTANGIVNTVDLSGESSGTFTVTMAGATPCSTSGGELFSTGASTNITDCFSSVTSVLGAQNGTDFQPGTTTGVTFGDSFPGGVLDLSAENGGAHLTVNIAGDILTSEGSLSGTSSSGSAISDPFYGVTTVTGSPNGTDFQPGTHSGVTFTGEGSTGNNDVDLSNESSQTSFSQFIVAMDGATALSTTLADASVSGTTVTVPSGGFPGVIDGMTVTGTNAPSGEKVASISTSNPNQLTLTTTWGTSVSGASLTFTTTSSLSCAAGAIIAGQTSSSASGNLDDCFSGVGVVNGAGSGMETVFEPDPTLTSSPSPTPVFIGNNPSAEASVVDLNLTHFSGGATVASLTAELNGDSASLPGQVSAVVSGNPVTFASFERANEIMGAPQTTTFRPDITTNVELVGEAASNVLDMSDETEASFGSTGTFNVTMSATKAACPLSSAEGDVTSNGSLAIADCFFGVTTVDGAPLPTTFVPSTSSSTTPTFVGFDSSPQGSVVDLSNMQNIAGSNLVVAMLFDTTTTPGQVTSASATYAKFAGVDEVIASTDVPTDFQPGWSPAVLLANNSSQADTLDLSEEGTPASGVTVAMNSDSSGVPGVLTGTSFNNTTLNDQFYGISTVLGAPAGTSVGLGSSVPTNFTFDGYCASTPTNVLDLSTDTNPPSITATNASSGLAAPTGYSCASEAKATVVLGSDSVTAYGVTEVKGSTSASTTYQAGSAPNVQFVGQGTSPNTLDLSASPSSAVYTVNMTSGTFSGPGATSGSFQDVSTVDGSPGGTIFEAASTGGATFNGYAAAIASNQLTLPTTTSTLAVSATQLSNLAANSAGLTTDTFSNIGQFNGNPGSGGTSFTAQAGSSSVNYVGQGSGTNSLSFSGLNSGSLTLDLVHDEALLSSTQIATFSGITNYTGCNCTSTTVEPADVTSAGFASGGSPNTLDYAGIPLGEAGVTVTETSGTGTAKTGEGGVVTFQSVGTYIGSPDSDVFDLGAGNVAVTGGGGSDTVSLANDSQGITFTSSYTAGSPSTDQTVITTLAGAKDTVTGISTLIGSSLGSNTFVSNGVGGYTYEAGSGGNVLDFSQAADTASLTNLVVNETGACSGGCVTGLSGNGAFSGTPTEDFFSGVQKVIGPTAGSTHFDSNAANGLIFAGNGKDNVLDLTSTTASSSGVLQVQDSGACAGTVSDGSSSSNYSDIAEVVGSLNGYTSFFPSSSQPLGACSSSSSSLTFEGQGNTGNTLDLSALPTAAGAIGTVVVPSSGVGTVSTGSTEFATFEDIQSFAGATNGYTDYLASSLGGFTFSGKATNNELSFAQSTSTVQVFLNASAQGGVDLANPGSGSDDTFTGISSVIGSPANGNAFFGGAGNLTVAGGGGTADSLSFAAAPNPITLNLSKGTATIGGGFSGSTTATGFSTFVGSDFGPNSFTTDSYGGYTFQAPTGSSGNSLSFANAESGTNLTSLAVVVSTSSGSGTASGLDATMTNGTTSDSFSGIQSFTGTPSSLSPFVLNSLSFSPVSSGVDVNMTAAEQTATFSNGQVDPISGFEAITGSAIGGNTFSTPSTGGFEFVGEGNGNTLDLSAAPAVPGIKVTPNGNSLASLGVVTNLSTGLNGPPGDTGAGDSADTFAGIQIFRGTSNSGSGTGAPTTFVAGCSGGEDFVGQGQYDTVDLSLSGCAASTPTINAATDTISGLPGGGQDTFSGITTFLGSSGGKTTFIAPGNSVANLDFVGATNSQGNTFDASAFPAGATIDDTTPTSGVATLGSDETDTFANVSCFVGSQSGSTIFMAPDAALSTAGCEHATSPNFLGAGSNNTLDLTAVNTTANGAASVSTTTSASASPTVTVGGATWDTFGGIENIVGSNEGDTTFLAGTVGGFNFEGQGNSVSQNTISFASIPSTGGGVQVDLNPNTQGQETANPGVNTDTFDGISNVIGSPASDTFSGGPDISAGQAWTITGNGGSDTLTYDSTTDQGQTPVQVSLLDGGATVTGGFSGQTTKTTGVQTFTGSPSGTNTFTTDAYGGYNFLAPSGTSGNSLSFQPAQSLGETGVSVSIPSSTGSGSASNLCPQTSPSSLTCVLTDTFQNIQSYTGSNLSDSFSVGSGTYQITGGSSGKNSITFGPAPAGVTADLLTGAVSSSAGDVHDTIANFASITGSSLGGNTFQTPATGGYQIIGGTGGGNTLDLGATQPAAAANCGKTGQPLCGIEVTVNGDNSTSPGTVTELTSGIGSSTQDTFQQIQSFDGSTKSSPTAPVTFEASCVGGLDFTGAGRATALYVAASATETGSPTGCAGIAPDVSAIAPGYVSGLTGGQDNFTNIQSFTGPSSGDTTFFAPGSPVSGMSFTGQGTGNVLDASAFPSGAVLDATTTPTGTATLSPSSTDSFSDMSCFVGSSAGGTTFRAPSGALSSSGCNDPSGQPNYLATGTGNTLDLSAVTTSSAAPAVVCGVASASCSTAGTVTVGGTSIGTYTSIQSFDGAADGHTTFVATSSSGQTFTGNGAATTNTLSLPTAPHQTSIDTTSQIVTLGGNTGTLKFSGIGAFVGSANGQTTFQPDSLNPYSFTGLSTGNTFDLFNAPPNAAVNLSCTGTFNGYPSGNYVIMASERSSTACASPTSGQVVDSFSDVQNFLGSQFGDLAYTAPPTSAGGLSFGGVGGGNSLSFATMTTVGGVTVNLLGDSVTNGANWSTPDTFSDIQTFTGTPNADTFLSGPVTATINGGGGSDTLSFANAENVAANVTLGAGATGAGTATGGYVGTPAQLTITGIQNVVGGLGGGKIIGNTLPSVFTGGSGANDFVVGGGPTVIDGGGTANTLDLSGATSFVMLNLALSQMQPTGGAGNLTLVPGTITDVIGGPFGNRLVAGPGNVTLNGGVGTDFLQAGSGTDSLNAGSGTATLVGGSGNDTMTGGGGTDTFIPGTGGGKIVDTAGVGTIDYALSTSSVHVNLNSSAYTTPDNKVTLLPDQATGGGDGTETLVGILNVTGTNAGDIIVGNSQSNHIVDGNGTNLIVGNGGGDSISTGNGANRIITGPGNNTVRAGTGTNTIDYSGAPGAVNVNLAKDTAKNGYGGTDSLSGITNIIGSDNNGDVLALGAHGGTIFAGSGSNDTLDGSSGGGSTLNGGSGTDTFVSTAANDHMFGGQGDDTFIANNGFVDYITGGSGYNIAYIDCLDYKDKTYTNIQELHLPSGGCSSSAAAAPAESSSAAPATTTVPYGTPAADAAAKAAATSTSTTSTTSSTSTTSTTTTTTSTTTTTVPAPAVAPATTTTTTTPAATGSGQGTSSSTTVTSTPAAGPSGATGSG